MHHILKQLGEWGTRLQRSEFERASWRLTLYYIISTFFILVFSSGAILLIYQAPTPINSVVDGKVVEPEHGDISWYELQEHLLPVMILTDIIILFFVSILSYGAARKTLSPIKQNQMRQLKFLSTVAHELRTPLAIMQAGGEAIARQSRSIAEYNDYVHDVQIETKRLTRLTHQLLQLLRGTEARQITSRCNLSQLIETELRRMDAYAKSKNVTLVHELAIDVMVEAVPDNLVQIIQNIVKNAIDYNRPDGQVTVALHTQNSRVEVRVSDTGVGIPEADLPCIFERFETLDRARTHREHTGAGLGLAIVKELVEAHGGNVAIASQVGVGTTITIVLPRADS